MRKLDIRTEETPSGDIGQTVVVARNVDEIYVNYMKRQTMEWYQDISESMNRLGTAQVTLNYHEKGNNKKLSGTIITK
jgi:uncharacterized protein YfaP (DUF2135 family)